MKGLKNRVIYCLILFWAGFSQLFWVIGPHIAEYHDPNLQTGLVQIIKGITMIGPDVLVLLLGLCLAYCKKIKFITIRVWANMFIVGCILCLIASLFSNEDLTREIYDALFPILRNSYPIVSGILLGLILGSIINQLNRHWQAISFGLILALITASTIFTPSIFGWSGQTISIFYALVFELGWIEGRQHFMNYPQRYWIFTCVGTLIVNSILQFVMPWFSINGSTIDRYSTPVNIVTVVMAFSLIKILFKFPIEDRVIQLTWIFLPLVEASVIATFLKDNVVSSIGHSSKLLGLVSLVVLVLALFISYIWQKLPMCKKIDQYLENFSTQIIGKQLSIVRGTLRKQKPNLVILIVSYLLALITMIGVNNTITFFNRNIFAYVIGSRQLPLLLTTLIIFMGVKFLQAITNCYWTSLSIVVIFNLVFLIGSILKIKARVEPVLPADVSSLNMELLKMVNVKLLLTAIVVFILVLIAAAFCDWKHPVNLGFTISHRLLWFFLLPIVLMSSLLWNQPGPFMNFMTSIGNTPAFYNQFDGARQNGPTLQFLNNIDIEVMNKPKGYSKKKMEKIVDQYQVTAKRFNNYRTNKLSDQTIIFNLSESFANPQRVPGVKLERNPVPYITSLKKQTTGGLMLSSGYGGGTANMEYMTLTGFSLSNFLPTMSVPYTQLVNKLKKEPTIVDSYDHAIAIHPFAGVFYSRVAVYKKFGFNKYIYLGSKYPIKHQHKIDRSPFLSDQTAYENALDQIKAYHKGQFINLITMQNHTPYDQNYYNNLPQYQAKQVSNGTNKKSVDDFATGIHYTDNYVKQFIRQIDQIQKPITIVFYGDHLPGIYGNSMAQDGKKLHETDYFIYSNRYARQHGAKILKRNVNYTDPNNFIAMVAKQTNSKVNWYQALLTDVYENVPAVAVNFTQSDSKTDRNEFVNQNGKIVHVRNFTKKQQRIWRDYQMVQYDITAGHHYVLKYLK